MVPKVEVLKNASKKDAFSNKNVLVWAGNLKQRLSNVNQTPVT